MRKKMTAVLACAAVGVTSGLTSKVKAQTFVDNFNNGSISNSDTIQNFWTTGAYIANDGSTVTEPVGGPLTLAWAQPPNFVQNDGPFMVSPLGNEFNPFTAPAPITVTLTAAPGGTLLPGNDTSGTNTAFTYISLNGTEGRPDNDGGARIAFEISNENLPQIVIKNGTNGNDYNYVIFAPANTMPQGNMTGINITSMFFSIDATQEASNHIYLNFGESWVVTSSGVTGTYTFEDKLGTTTPFDIGGGTNPQGPGQTQAAMDAVKAGFANGGQLAMEMLNGEFNFFGDESVPIGQVTDLNTYFWNNTGATATNDGKTWDAGTNANWVNMGLVNGSTTTTTYVDGSGSAVQFTDQNNGKYAVTLNTTVTPGSVLFSNSAATYTLSGTGGIAGSGSLTKSGTGRLIMSTANTYSGGTTVSNGGIIEIAPTANPATSSALGKGALTINNNSQVILDSNVTLGSQASPHPASSVSITSLAITGNGTLDITNNHIIINYGSGTDPIASIAALIASGYDGGGVNAWKGFGITSSAAAANAASYGIGYADSADPGNPAGLSSGQIEVMYTLLGDANLDGKVNGSDFSILAVNFNKAVGGWDQGDFNYDGKDNGADFTDLAANFNKGASQSADVAALDAFAAANGLLTSVPEPASLGLLLLGTTGLLGRRRRSC